MSFLDKLPGRKKPAIPKNQMPRVPQPKSQTLHTTTTKTSDPIAATKVLADEFAQEKGVRKQTKAQQQKRKSPLSIDSDAPKKKGKKSVGDDESKEDVLADLGPLVTDKWFSSMKSCSPLEILETVPSYCAKLAIAVSKAQEGILDARKGENDLTNMAQKVLAQQKRAEKAEAQNKELGEEKNSLKERLKVLEEEKRKVEVEKGELNKELERKERRLATCGREVEELKGQFNKAHEEIKEKVEAAKNEGRVAGMLEAGDKFMYITYLHYPNPKCTEFSYKIYGEAGVATRDEIDADEDAKASRKFIQDQYDVGVELPQLLQEYPEDMKDYKGQFAEMSELQRQANLSGQGQEGRAPPYDLGETTEQDQA